LEKPSTPTSTRHVKVNDNAAMINIYEQADEQEPGAEKEKPVIMDTQFRI
jgi:hypothetical protein